MKRISAWLFLWGVVSAWAVAGAAEIAVYPLHIEVELSNAKATEKALKDAFEKQILKTLSTYPEGVVANATEVERYIQQRGGASCWKDNGCIVALARAVKAKRVLLVSIVRTEPWFIMSARVVDWHGGEPSNIPVLVHTPNQDIAEEARFVDGFATLFEKLDVPMVLNTPVGTGRGEGEVSPKGMSGMRVASYTTMGVAAVGAVFGTVFTVRYFKDRKELNKVITGGASDVEDAPNALTYTQRAKDDELFLIIGWSVAGASLATSLVLFFLSPEYKPKNSALSFAPLQGGGMLTFSTKFP
ncbi:MAG: hypothetical protein FWC28_04945 [Proteobacteria bacterium]|nr:hypothetical protein [Cystobacterineae bacterium]MCL2259069.1 hypothetical protein [Cystobacterineae bacterium]MCL2314584.1 hypothetical protein [Pseudomonadota bacterium]